MEKDIANSYSKAEKILQKFPLPKNSRELAFTILYEVYTLDAFSDIAINRNFNLVNLDNLQKSEAAAFVYGTLSETFALDELISQFSKTPIKKLEARVLIILRLALWQLYFSQQKEHAAVSESVKLCSRFGVSSARGLVNAVLRNTLRSLKRENYQGQNIYSRSGFSKELYELFYSILGEEAKVIELSEYFKNNISLNVRIRKSKSGDKLPLKIIHDSLIEGGFKLEPASFQIDSFHLDSKGKSLHELDLWKAGYLKAQGEAAMLPAIALNPQAGENILDLCAAPGGKTIQMADLSNDEAIILANDLQEHRVKLIEKELERLNLKSIKTQVANASDIEFWNKDKEKFDKVLLDVPCSGLGLIHSKPELRSKFNSQNVKKELLPLQARILEVAANCLKIGGQMLYSTCTLNPEENEKQIENFLRKHKNFNLISLKENLHAIGKKLEELDPQIDLESGMLNLWPHKVKSEGFFIALLEKF